MAGVDPASLRLRRRVADFVRAQQVLRPGEHVLLLLSGGADSMALLDLLPAAGDRLGLGLAFSALHVDYRARGADSDRDRELVQTACARAAVPLHVVRLERRLQGGGFQARARELRYGHARELAERHGYDVLATGHNRDDQAETVLYRLVKYATPRGLVGMRPRERELARPLLCLGAAELRAYCARRGLEYGRDVTNARPDYARNALRLQVLPALAAINPRVAETLAAGAEQAAAEAEVLHAAAAGAAARCAAASAPGDLAALHVAALLAEPAPLRALVLHELARAALGGEVLVERRRVQALLALAEREDDAGRVSLGGGIEAVRGGGVLRLRRAAAAHLCAPLAVDAGELAAAGDEGVALVWCGRRLRLRLLDGAVLERDPAQAFVGLRAAPRRVALRHPRRGDRFAPVGLGAETTVARFLAAAGCAAAARPRAFVLDVDGAVAWVGYEGRGGEAAGRVAQPFAVDQSSVTTLHVRLEEDR